MNKKSCIYNSDLESRLFNHTNFDRVLSPERTARRNKIYQEIVDRGLIHALGWEVEMKANALIESGRITRGIKW